MSTSYSPKIITDGLVLCLDAGNIKSYAGSGADWYDLGTSQTSASLFNGPTYSTDNKGYISFDGTNDYARVSSASFVDPINGTGSFTVECWCKKTGINNSNPIILAKGYYYFDGLVLFSSYYSSTVPTVEFFTDNGNDRWMCNGPKDNTYFSGSWNQISCARSGSVISLHVNGRQVYSATPISSYGSVPLTATSVITTGRFDFSVAAGTYYGDFLGHDYNSEYVSSIRIYNRKLSTDEILQNYNSTKGRYGL